MSARFEELDWRPTPIGAISLRRRRDPSVRRRRLRGQARRRLPDVEPVHGGRDRGRPARLWPELSGAGLDVVVGGLGLGYTAQTVLRGPEVRSLLVVEALGEVIDWHERGLVPAGRGADRRSALPAASTATSLRWSRRLRASTRGARAAASTPSSSTSTTRRAICCIPSHAGFYEPAGLAPAGRRTCSRAASSRCGPTTRRTRHTRPCWLRSSPT